jgi:hypothetical protein
MRFIIDHEVFLSRPLEGPLASQVTAFAKWVREQGYAWHPGTGGFCLRRVLVDGSD